MAQISPLLPTTNHQQQQRQCTNACTIPRISDKDEQGIQSRSIQHTCMSLLLIMMINVGRGISIACEGTKGVMACASPVFGVLRRAERPIQLVGQDGA